MEVRRIVFPALVVALTGFMAAPVSAASLASVSVKDPGTDPLPDGAAAERV